MAFEAALAELERIVEGLERGDPDLGQALAGYARGVDLLGHCQGVLDQAERSVALLTGVDAAGRTSTAPFDAAATGVPAAPVIAPEPTPAAAPLGAAPPTPLTPDSPAATVPEAPF